MESSVFPRAKKMNTFPVLMSFEDVTVDFTWEEWQVLDDAHRNLYREVMRDTYRSLLSLGFCITKPEVIYRLEQGAEPWTDESPTQSFPGRATQRERESTICHLLFHCLNACSSQGWAMVKPGARNSMWISYVGGRGQDTGHVINCIREYTHRKRSMTVLNVGKLITTDQPSSYIGDLTQGKNVMSVPRVCMEGDLTFHQRTHTEEQPYKCDECGKTFSKKGGLTFHQRIHPGEQPYKCDECGRTFTRKGDLSFHQRTHIGEKAYVCSCCQKPFYWKSHLIAHQRTHTGEKPYECNICGQAFTERQTSSSIKTQKRGKAL